MISGGYSGAYGAAQALRNAIADALWYIDDNIFLYITQFILPPWFDRYFSQPFVAPWRCDQPGYCSICGKPEPAGLLANMLGEKPSDDGKIWSIHHRSFWTRRPTLGWVCSRRCYIWCSKEWASELPFWAWQPTMGHRDRYGLVQAMGRRHGRETELMLEMGYSLKVKESMYKCMPFEFVLMGEEPKLKEFYLRSAEKGSWYNKWKARKQSQMQKMKRRRVENVSGPNLRDVPHATMPDELNVIGFPMER